MEAFNGIIFQQTGSPDYRIRTLRNVEEADLTIAIAVNFQTPGEKLTASATVNYVRLYMRIHPLQPVEPQATQLLAVCKHYNVRSINVAGNSLNTLRGALDQPAADAFTARLFDHVLNAPFPGREWWDGLSLVRSGGQTGFDEAGLKAATRFGIKAVALFPRNFRARNAGNMEIYGLESLSRFGIAPDQWAKIQSYGVLE